MSKLTVSIPDDLHQKIRDELEKQGITTSQFIEQAVTNFFEKPKGDINMATRTLAFQVSEELFQRIKAYLARYEEVHHRKLSQKEFVIGLIEAELAEADEEFEAADSSITPQIRRRSNIGYAGDTYKVELNSPKLEYREMEKLQEAVRELRRAGGIPCLRLCGRSALMPLW